MVLSLAAVLVRLHKNYTTQNGLQRANACKPLICMVAWGAMSRWADGGIVARFPQVAVNGLLLELLHQLVPLADGRLIAVFAVGPLGLPCEIGHLPRHAPPVVMTGSCAAIAVSGCRRALSR